MLVSGFAALVLALAWRSRAWPLVHDAPILHYIAWRIADGAAPYRDVFDMNQPGVYALHVALLQTLGPGDTAWRAFDLTWLAVSAVAIAALAAPWGAAAAFGGALTFAAVHLAGGAWQAGQRDFLLCPFLLVGVLGVTRWLEGRGRLSLACSGAAMGAAVTVKPHAGILAAALGLVVIVVAARVGGVGTAAPATLTYAAAAMAAPLAMVVWLALAGGLGAWRQTVFEYLVPLYSRLGRDAAWAFHHGEVWLGLALGAALSTARVVWGRRFTARHALVLGGIAYGVVHYVAQGKFWEYHLHPLGAFIAVLLFAGFDPRLAAPRWTAAALSLVLMATLVVLSLKGVEAAPAGWERAKAAQVDELERELARRLGPGDTVQVLDTSDGGAHALLRLRVREPTRFIYDFHFFHDVETPFVRALRAELVRGLDARPPRLIVLFERGWPAGGYERIDAFPELADRLAGRYEIVSVSPSYRIYAKRHDP